MYGALDSIWVLFFLIVEL